MEYGLIGEKLSHSFSKEVHALIGSYDYQLKELQTNQLDSFILSKQFKGINVTIPYKQRVIPLLDFVDDLALQIGAVNTVVNKNGKLYGYNTDCLGVESLIEKLCLSIKGKNVIILGTGGTSKTVKAVVSELGAKSVLKVSREEGKGDITYSQLPEYYSTTDVLFNTTPSGMYPNVENAPVDLSGFINLQGVIDVIYNPLKTKLVLQAESLGVKAIGGLYMLVAQAVYAYGYFFNQTPSKTLIDQIYNKVLSSKQNVVLIGMPSCGKTTVGNLLSKRLNRQLIDTDQTIIESAGKPIKEIFAEFGEEYFRQLETEAIKSVSIKSGVIISTGGGAVLRNENVLSLSQNGKIFFIDRGLKNLISTDDRPLSNDSEKLTQMFNFRYPVYKKVAHVVVDGNLSIEEVAEQIIKEL